MPSLQIAEWATGVARVDARVRLQVILDRVHPEAAAALGREHAGRDRVSQPEGRADRHDPLADAGSVRVGELGGGEAGRVDADDGEVRRGIAAHEPGRKVAPVAEPNVDGERLFDDVIVREDGAVGGEDDAGARAAADGLVGALAPEEVGDRFGPLVAHGHVDLDDARAHAIGDRHEPVGQALRFGGGRLHLRGSGYGRGGRRGLGAGGGRLRERGGDDGDAEHRQ
jgi:hypothetical protein